MEKLLFPNIYFRPTARLPGKSLVKNNKDNRGETGEKSEISMIIREIFCKFPIFTSYMIPYSVYNVNTYFAFFGIYLPVFGMHNKFQFAGMPLRATRDCQSGSFPIFLPDSKLHLSYRAEMFNFVKFLGTSCQRRLAAKLQFELPEKK